MPEIAEIHRYADIINEKCKDLTFDKVIATDPKYYGFKLPAGPVQLSAKARGKELELTAGYQKFCWNHGLVGKWVFSANNNLPKFASLQFHGPHNFVLSYVDAQKMGRWREGSFDLKRSPDPIDEHNDFCKKVLQNIHQPAFQLPICQVLLNQDYFNGIGNYLRAETLHRACISPWEKACDVFKETERLFPTFDFQTINQNSDKGILLLWMCKAIPIEVLQKGLDKYGSPEEYATFEKWLRIYGKGETKDLNKRKVHFAAVLPTIVDLPDISPSSVANVDPIIRPTPSALVYCDPPKAASMETLTNDFRSNLNINEPQETSKPANESDTKQIIPQDIQKILGCGFPAMQTLLLFAHYFKLHNTIDSKHLEVIKVLILSEFKPLLIAFDAFQKTHNMPRFVESCIGLCQNTRDPNTIYQSFKESRKLQQRHPTAQTVSSLLNQSGTCEGPALEDWKAFLRSELTAPYFKEIIRYVKEERRKHTVFPKEKDVFAAFDATPVDNVKVVIIGQDPYFNDGQANGLCFSVSPGVPIPPSLQRMFKVLEAQIKGFTAPNCGDLTKWAKQGVLLLNATLTVQSGKPNSHEKCGWKRFTDAVIRLLNDKKEGLVFFLWGAFAQKKGSIIDTNRHFVLTHAHPSPLSGSAWHSCTHFQQCNEILRQKGQSAIDWTLP